jgi:4-hydroxy-tetrahydrodipicolinate synthase
MLHGIVPMLPTPFQPDGSMDNTSLRRIVADQLAAGADGLAILGLAGEGIFLSVEERQRVAEVVVEAAEGAPLLVGCTADTTKEAVRLAAHAAELGAAAIMVAPPRAKGWTALELAVHYRAVALEVPGCELMIQDAPGFIGVELGVELVLQLAAELANVRSFKVEALPFWEHAVHARQAAGPSLRLFGGHGGLYLLDCFDVQAEGLIPGTSLTPALSRAWRANATGDRATAEAEYRRILPFLVYQGQSLGLIIGAAKALLAARGVIASDAARHPEATLTGVTRERLFDLARQVGGL